MQMAPDSCTLELSEIVLSVHRHLRFTLQQLGDEQIYSVEDTVKGQFFQIGIPEYTFLSLLDGHTSVREAIRHTASVLGRDAFSEQDAISICRWLIDNELASTEGSRNAEQLTGITQKMNRRRWLQWINPLFLKVPLFNPGPLVSTAGFCVRWLFTLPGFLIWAVMVGIATWHLATHWQPFWAESENIVAMSNWLRLAVIWLLLKVLHELSHAVACKKFGGDVPEAGVCMFMILMPMPYLDLTSAWRLRSKWQRIIISAAGMYTELFVAAIAAIVWIQSDDPMVRQLAHHLIIVASISTVLFNANPFMRFDGYYIVSDLTGIPNLYTTSQQLVLRIVKRWFFGVKSKPPRMPKPRAAFLLLYGLGVAVWRIVLTASIALAAQALFRGAGIVLVAVSAIGWYLLPMSRFIRYLFRGTRNERPRLIRFAVCVTTTLGLLYLFFTKVPWPGTIRAPVVVEFADSTPVRAKTAGFVRVVLIHPGESVAQDRLVAVLKNYEVENELDDIRLALRQSTLRADQYREHEKIAAYQIELETIDSLRHRLDERKRQVEDLVIRASACGQIVAEEIETLIGRYVHVGEKIMEIAETEQKRLQVSISQDDYRFFKSCQGEHVDIYFRRQQLPTLVCSLGEVEPRARRQLPHPALGVSAGGPLAVRPPENSGNSDEANWQLVEPRFSALIELNAEDCRQLKPGQLGTVELRIGRGSIGSRLYELVNRWVCTKMDQ